MAKPPKLAVIENLDEFSHWLADTIQQQVSKENAGFVQVVRVVGGSSHSIEVTTSTHKFVADLHETGVS